jgi:hypothetical protein
MPAGSYRKRDVARAPAFNKTLVVEAEPIAMIRSCQLPPDALLNRYLASGAYVDCYVTEVARRVSHAEFVDAFYTTAVFKLERWILRVFVSRPSTDTQAGQLARGEVSSFAAWSVEGRAPDQLLLSDVSGRTRSWLMVAVADNSDFIGTWLYFGSAVVPMRSPKTGRASLGPVFSALLGFHRLYSRVLLRAAGRRLSSKAANNLHVHRDA